MDNGISKSSKNVAAEVISLLSLVTWGAFIICPLDLFFESVGYRAFMWPHALLTLLFKASRALAVGWNFAIWLKAMSLLPRKYCV